MTRSITVHDLLAAAGDAGRAVHGSLEATVTHAAPIREARDRGALTFCTLPEPDALEVMRTTAAGVIVCGEAQATAEARALGKTLIVAEAPRLTFLRLVAQFLAPPPPRGRHPTACVEDSADVHPDTWIGPFAYVGRATVGQGCVIHGQVQILDGCRLGRDVTVHAGTVIGADGFGYQRNERGELEKFPHIGGVVIEDGVEIGANACIDRGTLGDTIVREGARIDNLVHIAHNVVVGRHAAVIAHAMVGGSTTIGDGAWIAPSACIRDGLEIGSRATVGLGAVVVKNVPDGTTVMGAPARPMAEYRVLLDSLRRLGAPPAG